ncbi:hypothetical protein GCM10007874_52140 [Labrys miyagiensis]|uniref:Integrase n=1 Tax=Labrys miyagiensis TaxID=346912 RepID=A0ABQ6CV94_9HYPH|nr:hypothetical protein [Labrys miyagiensis]GLS22197.1 hypothetical protein GCM10007874_52140 [Labrys miyagiensis]
MATFTKLPSGSWRVQIRRKGRGVSETFQRPEDARRWALGADVKADRGETPISSRIAKIKTLGELIDLHIQDMTAVDKTPLRSKAAALDLLKRELGKCKISALDRERLIKFGRDRARHRAQGLEVAEAIYTPEARRLACNLQFKGRVSSWPLTYLADGSKPRRRAANQAASI